MSTISSVSSVLQTRTLTLDVSVNQAAKPNAKPVHSDLKPVTIVDFSPKTAGATSTGQNLRTLNPEAVSDGIARVEGANGFAFIASHFAKAAYAAKFGEARAEAAAQGEISQAFKLTGAAAAAASGAGVPVQNSINSLDDAKNYAASGSLIPGLPDQNRCSQSRSPSDIMVQG